MAFHPRADAAPEAIVVGGPGAARPRRERHEIGEHAAFGVLVRKDVVEVDALVIIEQRGIGRSEEHTSELQSLMRISYAVFCLKKKRNHSIYTSTHNNTIHTIITIHIHNT